MADFYSTAAGFRAYHLERGTTLDVALTDLQIDASLLVASEWLDATYRQSFAGIKNGGRGQVREFPRTGHYDYYGYAIDNAIVPREILASACEVALKNINNPALLSKDLTPNEFKRVSVDGAISVEYNTFNNSGQFQITFQIVTELMASLIPGNSGASNFSGLVAR